MQHDALAEHQIEVDLAGRTAHRAVAHERRLRREALGDALRGRARDRIHAEPRRDAARGRTHPCREVGSVHQHRIAAQREQLVHHLRPPDDVDRAHARKTREPDQIPPAAGVGRVLHQPVPRLQRCEILEQHRSRRAVDRQQRELRGVALGRGQAISAPATQPLPEGAAAERREHAVAGREARIAPRALDAADALETRRARQRSAEGRRALDGAQVGDVHRGRLHAHHDLALGGIAGILLHDAQHLARRAVGLVHRGAAQRMPRSVMRAIASACRARK